MNEQKTLALPVPSDAEIIANAQKATLEYSDVNQACPYPFRSREGDLFCQAFTAERARQDDEIIKESFAVVSKNATKAFMAISAEMLHQNSIASDAAAGDQV